MENLAAAILAGMLANPGGPLQSSHQCGTDFVNGAENFVAKWAVQFAYEIEEEVRRKEEEIENESHGGFVVSCCLCDEIVSFNDATEKPWSMSNSGDAVCDECRQARHDQTTKLGKK